MEKFNFNEFLIADNIEIKDEYEDFKHIGGYSFFTLPDNPEIIDSDSFEILSTKKKDGYDFTKSQNIEDYKARLPLKITNIN